MEDEEKNRMILDLFSRKRKLEELRERLKSSENPSRDEVNGHGNIDQPDMTSHRPEVTTSTLPPRPDQELQNVTDVYNILQTGCSPGIPYSNELPSISPPPFSPLTPLLFGFGSKYNKYENKSQSEFDSNPISRSGSSASSSPVRPMTPETQSLFNDLNEAGRLDIVEDSDDSIKDPDFVLENEERSSSDSENERELDSVLSVSNTEQQNVPDQNCNQNNENGNLEGNINSTNSINDNIALVDSNNVIELTTETNETNINTEILKIKRSRRERKESKRLRNIGKSYVTEKGKTVPDRQSKELGSCRLKCAERFTVNERNTCFEEYWKLGERDRRAGFIAKAISIQPKKSQTTDSRTKNRDCYCIYKLVVSKEEKVTCKECFCRILGETKGFVNIIINKKKMSSTGIVALDQRGLCPPANKKTIEDFTSAINHINSFPSYESHYCRKSTGKKYLPSDLSIAKMYRDYIDTTTTPISLKLYSKCFHDLNLSFKKPSKDTCNTCDVLNAKIKIADEHLKITLTTELDIHQGLAEKAYNEKRMDKEIAKNDSSVAVFAFDLQQCLPTPYLKTSVSFYKRQLWSFNLTIHNIGNNEATCYMWDETIGARGANQIASCLWHFCYALPPEVKEVIFYSDTCGGQNKNNIVAMMFMFLLKTHPTLQTIKHKFLLSGHTHMECDSDHAIIEKTKKRTRMKINHLNDWVQLVRSCKVQNPFQVVVMTLENFLDFSDLKSKKGPFTIKKVNDDGDKFLWQPIKWLQYDKSDVYSLYYKDNLDRETPFQSVNLKKRGKPSMESYKLKQISMDLLPISAEKKKDLMDLLELIDEPFKNFYVQIKTVNCASADPDIDEINPDLEDVEE